MPCHSTKSLLCVVRNPADASGLHRRIIVPVFCACMIAAQGAIAGMDYMRLSQPNPDRATEGIPSVPQQNLFPEISKHNGVST